MPDSRYQVLLNPGVKSCRRMICRAFRDAMRQRKVQVAEGAWYMYRNKYLDHGNETRNNVVSKMARTPTLSVGCSIGKDAYNYLASFLH